MGLNTYSDYGSGSSMNSDFQELEGWLGLGRPLETAAASAAKQRTSSYVDLLLGRCTIDDVMKEFRMNGSDAPYNPDEEVWTPKTSTARDSLVSGSSVSYLRQSSWPAPELSPSQPLPRPAPQRPASLLASSPPPAAPATLLSAAALTDASAWCGDFASFAQNVTSTSTPINDPSTPQTPSSQLEYLTDEQRRVLSSLPSDAIYSLLRQIETARGHTEVTTDGKRSKKKSEECRFCKNNGERESYYKSHVLKDASGRVACPVLRAFVCRRCGASGDAAHTAKYCPLASNEERVKCAAMMRSVRMASGKRRHGSADADGCGGRRMPQQMPSQTQMQMQTCDYEQMALEAAQYAHPQATLAPQWAALVHKLMQ